MLVSNRMSTSSSSFDDIMQSYSLIISNFTTSVGNIMTDFHEELKG